MKKLVIGILLMVLAAPAYAGTLKPKTAWERCMRSVEKACEEQGLLNPWGGGNATAWNNCTRDKYNACWCQHKGKPLPNQTC
jgi:hypothetical protein